ncbi:MAG: hypothetical protein ACREXT_08135, partial [Gammaproteobacteria bacterium]
MNTLDAGLLVLTVEFALVACGLAFLQWRGGRRQTLKETNTVGDLVATVEGATDARREALTAIFTATYGFDAAEATRAVADFMERERAFYNAMISIHLGRGGKSLADVPNELTRVVAP